MTVVHSTLVVAVGMRTRFRGVTTREAMLFRGESGWGEWSPFLEYADEECVPWLRAAREAADVGWPDPVRDRVPVNVTVPAVDPVTAQRLVRMSNGCTTAKVKVAEPGQSEAEDLLRVAAVRDSLGPDGRIRVDANGAWDVDTALRRIKALDTEAGGLEYVEQPCATVEELADVRRHANVSVAADESIRRSDDPMRVVQARAADVLVLKVQPLGGVRACLDLAERCGLPVVVSSALETSVGIAAGVALAAALPELPYACGLATVQLLERDVTSRPLLPVEGHIQVRRVEADRPAGADTSRARWWQERLGRTLDAAALLDGSSDL
ncbi:MAG: o-succinylbenzoate synthase [Candidatus Nanopelagicales bacterium]